MNLWLTPIFKRHHGKSSTTTMASRSERYTCSHGGCSRKEQGGRNVEINRDEIKRVIDDLETKAAVDDNEAASAAYLYAAEELKKVGK